MDRERREAEKAARRARRLAERAEERARRKEDQAKRAAERAERLAERAARRPRRERDLERSIEDLVDEMTDKAERWIDDQTRSMFSTQNEEKEVRRAEGEARRARQEASHARNTAERAEKAADEMSSLGEAFDEESLMDSEFGYDDGDYGLDDGMYDDGSYFDGDFEEDGYESGGRSRRAERKARRRARRQARKQRKYGYGREDYGFFSGDWYGSSKRRARHRKTAHLYRDKQRKKIMGVCAGLADYWGRPTWEIRLYAVLGLFFIPSVTVPTYFIMAFLMDDKPYYRRVTDRFEEPVANRKRDRKDRDGKRETAAESKSDDKMRSQPKQNVMNHAEAMKTAKNKFADIEQRLRKMETHVTSNRFELQREFKKISGDS